MALCTDLKIRHCSNVVHVEEHAVLRREGRKAENANAGSMREQVYSAFCFNNRPNLSVCAVLAPRRLFQVLFDAAAPVLVRPPVGQENVET